MFDYFLKKWTFFLFIIYPRKVIFPLSFSYPPLFCFLHQTSQQQPNYWSFKVSAASNNFQSLSSIRCVCVFLFCGVVPTPHLPVFTVLFVMQLPALLVPREGFVCTSKYDFTPLNCVLWRGCQKLLQLLRLYLFGVSVGSGNLQAKPWRLKT